VKNCPKCSPTHFFVKINTSFSAKKVAQQLCSATSVIFEKLPKVNNRAVGEKSANLVTLISTLDSTPVWLLWEKFNLKQKRMSFYKQT
jgi:hypothetical protein